MKLYAPQLQLTVVMICISVCNAETGSFNVQRVDLTIPREAKTNLYIVAGTKKSINQDNVLPESEESVCINALKTEHSPT